jgi:hypothetical protein
MIPLSYDAGEAHLSFISDIPAINVNNVVWNRTSGNGGLGKLFSGAGMKRQNSYIDVINLSLTFYFSADRLQDRA